MIRLFALAIAFYAGGCIAVFAGVQLSWDVDVARVAPVNLEAYHGETLDLSARLNVSGGAQTATFLWQTNGMGSAWWQTNATVNGNVVSASFTPAMDTGADRVRFFFGVVDGSGANYRAAGTIALRTSPGAAPSSADLPAPGGTLNFAEIQIQNAPWATLEAVDAAIAAATNALPAPSVQDLSGYATMEEVEDAITAATNAYTVTPTDLSPYCTVEAAQALVQAYSNALANAIQAAVAGISIPSISGYATESYVQASLSAYVPTVDLSGYATTDSVAAAVSNAVANLSIPSLSGYATESYVLTTLSNYQPTIDLSGYATKEYADAAAAAAAAAVRVPSLAGYATEQYVQNAVSGGITRQTRSTVLETLDGSTFQDATGVVWQVTMNSAWVGTNGTVYVDDGSSTNFVAAGTQTRISWIRDDWYFYDGEYANALDDDNVTEHTRDMSTINWYRFGSWSWQPNEAAGYSTNVMKHVAYTTDGGGDASAAKILKDGDYYQDVTGCVWRIESVENYVYSPWRWSGTDAILHIEWESIDSDHGWRIFVDGDATAILSHDADATELSADTTPVPPGYGLGDSWRAWRDVLSTPGIFTNLVGKVAMTNDIPRTAAQIGAAPASVADTVQAWQTYWDGDDVRVTVTNYYGNLGTPSLYLEQKMPADETHESSWFKTIWDERTRWNAFLAGYASLTNHVNQDLADRAWGLYDSSTGAYSPDGLLQLSQDQIMIASGMAWQKTVTTGGGSVWILTATTPFVMSGESTNGFFKITDGDGHALFEIVKGDKQIVPATPTSCVKYIDGFSVGFSVDSIQFQHPVGEVAMDLDGQYVPEDSLDGLSVTWNGESGYWVATVTATPPHAMPNKMFFRATYETGGNTYIRNNVATSIDKVVVGGIEYTVTVETVNGRKLMVLQ